MNYGIASGYFAVTLEHLEKLGEEKGKDFLFEMWTRGGRIGHDEYCLWLKRMNWKVA